MGLAKQRERQHGATHLLRELTYWPSKDVVNQLVGFGSGGASGLAKLQSLFEEAMVALATIGGSFPPEARDCPRQRAELVCRRAERVRLFIPCRAPNQRLQRRDGACPGHFERLALFLDRKPEVVFGACLLHFIENGP